VGTVWLAVAGAPGRKLESRLLRLDGDRSAVRHHTVLHALALLREELR
jgi:nicotinamide mononucleotide (NMN) deamidase PncC